MSRKKLKKAEKEVTESTESTEKKVAETVTISKENFDELVSRLKIANEREAFANEMGGFYNIVSEVKDYRQLKGFLQKVIDSVQHVNLYKKQLLEMIEQFNPVIIAFTEGGILEKGKSANKAYRLFKRYQPLLEDIKASLSTNYKAEEWTAMYELMRRSELRMDEAMQVLEIPQNNNQNLQLQNTNSNVEEKI